MSGSRGRLPLLRGGTRVETFLSALGDLRETRLTATLGYVAARFPDHFLPLMGLDPRSGGSISVEESDEGDRYDLLLSDRRRPVVVEAKLDDGHHSKQLARYLRHVRTRHKRRPRLVYVDRSSKHGRAHHSDPHGVRRLAADVHFVTWTEVAAACRAASSGRRSIEREPIATAIAQDLATYLEETGMATPERKEVYTRDLSSRESVELFFRHNIYSCQSKFYKSAQGNLYFAPHFTGRAMNLRAETLVPIPEGFSFLARIKDVQVMPKGEVRSYLADMKWPSARRAAELLRQHHRGARDVLVMPLGEPHQLFSPPVSKRQLRRVVDIGTGLLGSRSFTLEQLLAASASR